VCGNSRGSSKSQKVSTQPRWRKILYEKQPYEDNYVDETFLNALVKNANFSSYSLPEVIKGSTLVTQQISTVALFLILFIYTLNYTLALSSLVGFEVVTMILGFGVRIITDVSFDVSSCIGTAKTLVLLFGSLFSLSPVLRTLTNSFSNDTIASCTCILLSMHLFFHDYGYINGDTNKFTAPVSLNAAIFASVLLGSRLPSNLHVFVLVSVAIEMFALFPIMRHYLKKYSQLWHNVLTALMVVVDFALFLPISVTVAVLYATLIIFITVGCPFWLVFIQKYKNEINGPWDEAVPVTWSYQ
jgi:phosphatidylinositol glycan class C protein